VVLPAPLRLAFEGRVAEFLKREAAGIKASDARAEVEGV
jgi:hypothetical protein